MPVGGVDRAADARAQQEARAEQIRAENDRRRAEADKARQEARAKVESRDQGGRAVDVRG